MAVQQGGFKPGGGGFNKPGGAGGGFNKPGGFNKGGFRGRFVPRKEAEHRINNFIRVPQVRLVGENVEVGVYSTQDALRMAQDQQLDQGEGTSRGFGDQIGIHRRGDGAPPRRVGPQGDTVGESDDLVGLL